MTRQATNHTASDATRAVGRDHRATGLPRPIVRWPEEVDDVLAGDATAGLAYLTPPGGAVVVGVAPLGLRDRDRGTVTITTSLGLPHKLERMLRDPHVALAFHAREHGFSSSGRYVLVQGDAKVALEPDEHWLDRVATPASERFMGPIRTGAFWDRWLREYYHQRVAVKIAVRRVVSWPHLRCNGAPEIFGSDLPAAAPDQSPPDGGIVPRVDIERAAHRAREMRHCLIAFRGADDYPVTLPVAIGAVHAAGFEIDATPGVLPGGTRRAGLLAHEYGNELVPIAARQLTGWLTVDERAENASYTPFTDDGFSAPANKTLVLLANGWLAKRGFHKALKSGRLDRLRRQQDQSLAGQPTRARDGTESEERPWQ